jgi:hypothetical protein
MPQAKGDRACPPGSVVTLPAIEFPCTASSAQPQASVALAPVVPAPAAPRHLSCRRGVPVCSPRTNRAGEDSTRESDRLIGSVLTKRRPRSSRLARFVLVNK